MNKGKIFVPNVQKLKEANERVKKQFEYFNTKEFTKEEIQERKRLEEDTYYSMSILRKRVEEVCPIT